MNNYKIYKIAGIAALLFLMACGIPKFQQKTENKAVPESYLGSQDSNNIADLNWKSFFTDSNLIALIDTALSNNQEFNIVQQEINITNNEVMARKGEYLPYVNVNGGAGFEKVGRYTRDGAVEANVEIEPGKEFPDPLQDYGVAFEATWEIDIWRKLRNGRDAAVNRYLGSIEGKNFMQTELVSEVAMSYYELLALDKQLSITQEYIQLQLNALKIVKLEKESGEETELAVKKFEAEVLSTQGTQYQIMQAIIETENKLNFLLGRYPQPIQRSIASFDNELPATVSAGVPSQLLANRPDIKQAEYQLLASKLDVKVAKARFYPSFEISSGVGLQAFNPAYFLKSPQSLAYGLAGDLAAPLINRKAIKAGYLSANSNQIQAVYDYEQTILNAYVEVYNQVAKLDNLKKSYDLKTQEVTVLSEAIVIANDLFMSARADYMEILLTQRDALDAKLEQVEYKQLRFISMISLYKACGGGWR